MAITPLSFSRVWTDNSDEHGFKTYESSEQKVREDQQLLFDEIKDFINDNLLGTYSGTGGASEVGVAVSPDFPSAVNVQALMNAILSKLKDASASAYLGGPTTFTWEDKSGDTHTITVTPAPGERATLSMFFAVLAKHLSDFTIDGVSDKFDANKIQYSSTDIGEGAPLATGTFYFVYK